MEGVDEPAHHRGNDQQPREGRDGEGETEADDRFGSPHANRTIGPSREFAASPGDITDDCQARADDQFRKGNVQ